MRRLFYTGILAALFCVLAISQVSAGHNADARIYFDGYIGEGAISKSYTGTDAFETTIRIENIALPIDRLMVQFEFNSTVLDLSPAGFSPSQPEMDINWESDTHSIGVSGRFHKISPPPNNYLTFTARFTPKRDVSNLPFSIELKSVTIISNNPSSTNIIVPTLRNVILFNGATLTDTQQTSNPTSPTQPATQNIPRKNMLPGDINGDGSVTFVDFLILSDNFGKTGGDTFDPNDLVEVSLLPTQTTTPVTVTVTETITVETTKYYGDVNLPKIEIIPSGDFENSPRFRYAFNSVRDIFSELLAHPAGSDIVLRSTTGGRVAPQVRYKREPDGSHAVYVPAPDIFFKGQPHESIPWARPLSQFAHEYGHIMANYRDEGVYGKQKWFEESIAMIAQYVALTRLQKKWEKDPPDQYPTIKFDVDYKNFLGQANDDIKPSRWGVTNPPVPTDPTSVGQWYRDNKSYLEATAPNLSRKEQTVVAYVLRGLFERYPSDAWNAVRYLNTWPSKENTSFQSYLTHWYLRTPPQWQHIVEEIMRRFEIQKSTKPAVELSIEASRIE